jgi:hypothetical protein
MCDSVQFGASWQRPEQAANGWESIFVGAARITAEQFFI